MLRYFLTYSFSKWRILFERNDIFKTILYQAICSNSENPVDIRVIVGSMKTGYDIIIIIFDPVLGLELET